MEKCTAWLPRSYAAYLVFGPSSCFRVSCIQNVAKRRKSKRNRAPAEIPEASTNTFKIPAKYVPLTTQACNHKEQSKLCLTPEECVKVLMCWYKEGCTFGLVDIRDEASFSHSHIVESTWLPWGENGKQFWARLHELPPRGKSLDTPNLPD